jgi:hypothetical protein
MRQPWDGEPKQEALFHIEGPDEDGCVWVCSPNGRDMWCQNLGSKDEVAEVLCQWLASLTMGKTLRVADPTGGYLIVPRPSGS